MDNNLNNQTTENSEGEEKSPSSYTDPNAGYTEAEPQAKNDNSVPKELKGTRPQEREMTVCYKGRKKKVIRHILTVKCQSQKTEAATDSQHRAKALAIPELRMELMKIILTTEIRIITEPIRAELIPMGTLTTSIRIAVIIPDLTRAATITITIARTIIRGRQSRWIYPHFLPENGF